MRALADWQDAFAAALQGDAVSHPTVAALAALPAFAVYRNTVWKGWVDAIEANYPAVARLTGREWLRAAAAAFAARHPPEAPALIAYGAGFPDFLAGLPAAAEICCLEPLARLDRAWTEAHVAADAVPLAPAAVAALAPADLAHLTARPHPAARAFWFEASVPTVWRANRADFPGGALRLDPTPEGMLLTRPGATVEVAALDAAGHVLFAACRAGRPLLAAAQAALAASPDADPGATLFRLTALGAFAGLAEADSEDVP